MLHPNDRKPLAEELGLSLEKFDSLVDLANSAHGLLVKMGPFYGKEDMPEPTFRVTAEPVTLPANAEPLLKNLGNDLFKLGKALSKLPDQYKQLLGEGLDFRVPLSWRIDSIIDSSDNIKLNEIEGIDSVSALMMAEQLAYNLQPMDQTTAFKLVSALQSMYPSSKESPLRVAIVRDDLENNPFTPNARRLVEFFKSLSNGQVEGDIYDFAQLKSKQVKPEWDKYQVVLSEAYCSPQDLKELGVKEEQLLGAGNYNALVNKGVFALFHESAVEEFWKQELGEDVFKRLKEVIIPSKFVTTVDQMHEARKEGKVVKVSWAQGNQIIINRCKGVAIPTGDLEESTDEKWNTLEGYLKQGYKLIAQDFVEPKKIPAYLRKRGTTLEYVQWYNRVCGKYVCEGNPNGETAPAVTLTAIEVTLGPEIIPAGRKCAFTAGKFQD